MDVSTLQALQTLIPLAGTWIAAILAFPIALLMCGSWGGFGYGGITQIAIIR